MSSSEPGHHRPRSRFAAGLPAVTAERVVDAALGLTEELGLENWTLRQLAAAVDAYPAVIYHHVGDRDAVVAAVIERVITGYPLPPDDLPWRDWFVELLRELRGVLKQYPGVARRLSLYGPSVKSAAKTIDRGVRLLQQAGFGDESPLVYHLLLNTACQFLAAEDDRVRDPAEGLRVAHAWMAYRDCAEMPGMALMAESVRARVENPELIAAYYPSLYEYAIQRCLDGVAVRLEELKRNT
ncbi:TetR/AcrR family transcriptional regulator [Amycolatopsis nigrescens]|uniref:TetR/AcrR family transcriptional regulator n=1 Tax=Amycolatopsis nigrescens TaxID=381445 RepID=UPI0003651439|nr:TetR/AcrR family transcriptional regulator C-terminal domain-containing protein [Amycolatopsis nigrescens]